MSRPTALRHHFAAICAAALIVFSACKPENDDSQDSGEACQTRVDDTATSPAPGTLTLHGEFYSDETVILGYSDPVTGNPRTVSGTPATNRTSFTLTGLPSGTRTYLVSLSCGSLGNHIYNSYSYTVQ